MCINLERIEFILEKKILNFLGAVFLMPKSSHWPEKQPVLGPAFSLPLLQKLTPRKLKPWFVLWSFSSWLLFVSVNLSYGLAWNSVAMYVLVVPVYLDVLDMIQKCVGRTVGPSHSSSLTSLAHCWNVASLSLSCLNEFDTE